MKHLVNISRNFLLPLLTALFFVSCTIIDNDLRDLPDENPAFKQIIHIEGEGWEADYQYQPWTKILYEDFMTYVADVDYIDFIIYLYNYIPEDLLPKEGDVLAAAPCEKLEWGLSHKVIGVKSEGYFYAVKIQPAEIKEVFKHLEYNQESTYVIQFEKEVEDKDPSTRGLYLKQVNTTRGDENKNYDDFKDEDEQKEWAKQQQERAAPLSNPNDEAWKQDESFQKPLTLDIGGLLASVVMFKSAWKGKSWKDIGKADLQNAIASLGLSANSALAYGSNEHNVYTLNFHNFSGSGLELKPGSSYIDSKKNINDAPNPSFYFNGDISMDLTYKPVVTVKNYINSDEDKFECWVYTGIEAKLFIAIAAELGINVNLWSATPVSACIGAPIGLPLWFELGLSIDWYLAGRVDFSAEYTKVFGIKVGAKQNMGGLKNGKIEYIGESTNPDAKFDVNESWNKNVSTYGGVRTGLVFTASPTLTLGFPEKAKEVAEEAKKMRETFKATGGSTNVDLNVLFPEFSPNLQLKYSPSIGFEASLGATNDPTTTNDLVFHIGIPVTLTDVYLIANLTKNFSPQTNIGKTIVGIISKNLNLNASKLSRFELWGHDFRLNPSVDDMSIACLNWDEPTEVPNFQIDFDINNLGGIGIGMKPCIKIYRYGENENPIETIDDFEPLKESDEGKHFSRKIMNNSNLKRAVAYTAKVEFYKNNSRQFTKKQDFSSYSPAACISYGTVYYRNADYLKSDIDAKWKDSYESQEPPKEILKAVHYDFGFRTYVMLQNPQLIEELGFYIGNKEKKYKVLENMNKAEYVKWKAANVHWLMEDNKEPLRSFKIIPYVKYNGVIYVQSWHTPYIMKLDYYGEPRDPNYGGNDKPYKRRTVNVNKEPRDCLSYGKDETEDPDNVHDKDNDAMVNEEYTYQPKKVAKMIGEKNGVPNFLIRLAPEDLE